MNDKVYLPPIPGQDLPPLPTEEPFESLSEELIEEPVEEIAREEITVDKVKEDIEAEEEYVNFSEPELLQDPVAEVILEVESDIDLNEDSVIKQELFNGPEEPSVETVKVLKRTKESKTALIIGVFIILISLGFASSVFISSSDSVTFSKVSKTTKLSLMSYINSPVDKGLKVKIKKVNTGPTLWLVSNYRLDAKVVLNLSSKKKRILGLDKVNIKSVGSFKSGAAYLSKVVLEDGLSITPGEYHFTVSFYPKGMNYQINNFLKRYFKYNFYKEEMAQSEFEGDVIFYKKGVREFEKKIKQFHLTIDKKIRDPLKEQLSRYKTFDGLLERSFSHYVSKIDSFKKGSDVSRFEKLYNKDVGPFLRDLMIDANRIHIANLNIDPQKSKVYEDIFNIGVRIGEMASDMVTDTIKFTKLSKKNRQSLRKKFAEVFTEIQLDISSQTSNIKLELAKYED